jgi:hypothetical protein
MLDRLSAILDEFSDASLTADAIDAAASGTCADVSDALAAVIAGIPGQAGTLTPLKNTADAACSTLASTVNDLLETPLITLKTLEVSLRTVAMPGSPVAVVAGTLASLKVGALAPVGVPLSLDGGDFEAAAATVTEAVTAALDALALGLEAPELALMKTVTSKGKRTDGTWYANASLTALHFRLPPSSVSAPASDPMGILAGTGGLSTPSHASSPGRASAPVSTPSVQLDIAKFTGSSTFNPGVNGLTLAFTGLDESSAVILALMLLSGALLVRRFLISA